MGKQTPKMSSRVVNAIRNLREAHGSTSKEIMNYIMSQCNVHESTVNRQVASSYLFFLLKKKNSIVIEQNLQKYIFRGSI